MFKTKTQEKNCIQAIYQPQRSNYLQCQKMIPNDLSDFTVGPTEVTRSFAIEFKEVGGGQDFTSDVCICTIEREHLGTTIIITNK